MTDAVRGRWFPENPPRWPGETSSAYTNRLTGADRTGRVPFDHQRGRECSLGFHETCSDPEGSSCECPCHTEVGRLEWRVALLEEALVAVWSLSGNYQPVPGVRAKAGAEVQEIVTRRPKLAGWYLKPGDPQ